MYGWKYETIKEFRDKWKNKQAKTELSWPQLIKIIDWGGVLDANGESN